MNKSQSLGVARLAKRYLVVTCTLVVILPVLAIHRLAFLLDPIFFPGLRKVVVRRPLFVVGPPRSGTTLMHRLLADNRQQFTTFALWELLLAPALCEKYLLGGIARLDRFFGSPIRRVIVWIEQKFSKSLAGVHQTSLFLPEEDYLGLLPFGGCFLAVLAFPKADWVWRLGNFSNRLSPSRKARLIKAYQGLLQRHLYYRGTDKVVLSKNPTFSAWLPSLIESFPDARFIGLLREPLEIVPSQLSSVREGIGYFGNDVADPKIRDAFVSLLAGYYRQVSVSLAAMSEDQAEIVDYPRLKNCSDQVVLECLKRFGYQVPPDYEAAMKQQATSVSGYRSGHRYTLEDFGLTKVEIETAFASAQAVAAKAIGDDRSDVEAIDSEEDNNMKVHKGEIVHS